jgi:biopolymer transport protein ExbB
MILLVETSVQMSYFDLIMKGGWLMIPLFLLSIISVFIFGDRYIYLINHKKADDSFFEKLKELVKGGKIDTAIALCTSSNSSEARILLKGLQNLGKPVHEINEQMEMEGKLEIYNYEGNMYFLGVIASIAPMLGFIGTIAGVIKIFYNISLADNISISLISGGLYEKLICSGVGLFVGILAYVGYHYLNHKINKMTQNWEKQCVRFIDLINSASV